MRQFYLELAAETIPHAGQTVVLDSDESHHLFTVLRGGRDVVLNLTDGRGRRFTAKPVGQDRRAAEVEILTVTEDVHELVPPRLELACAVVKGKRFEWALEKAVEMGAHCICPLITEHGVIEPGGGKRQRWLTIMKSALKQSGRSWLPVLEDSAHLGDYLGQEKEGLLLYGAVPGEVAGAASWANLLAPQPEPVPAVVTIAIGPEGGWSETELSTLTHRGAVPVDLGPHVLRTETAAVAGLAALQALRGAWSTAGPTSESSG